MSFRFARFEWVLAAMVVLAACPAGRGQQPPSKRGRTIQFSEPKRETVATNLNRLATQKRTLTELEEQLKKPLEIIDLEPPMDRLPLQRLPPPNLDSKRLKELIEKRKEQEEWIFLSPDDYSPTLSLEEIFKIEEFDADGQVKRKGTPLERYFERLESERLAAITNQVKNESVYGSDSPDKQSVASRAASEDSAHEAALPAPEQILKRLYASDSEETAKSEYAKPRNLAEMLGGSKPVESPVLKRVQEQRLAEYQRLLGASTSSLQPVGGEPALKSSQGSLGFASPLGAPSAPAPKPPVASQPLPATPALAGGLPQSPLEWSGLPGNPAPPTTTTPVLEPPRTPAPPPTFSLPRRRF